MERFSFYEIFRRNPDGTLTPKRTINVNNITFGQGVSFGPGVSLGGVDFFDYLGYDIAAEEENSVLVIRGFYKKSKVHD